MEVWSHLESFFTENGTPSIFQSDNGGEFVGTEVASLLESLSIKFVHGRPRTPRVQGKVEKFNGTLPDLGRSPFEL